MTYEKKVNQATHVYKSACPYDCFDCCSFDVYVKHDKVDKIKANKDADYTGNFICQKGLAHSERMYRQDRLRYPLVKTPQGHVRISWEQAYEMITSKIKDAQRQDGLTSVGGYLGGGAAGKLKASQQVFLAHLGGYTDFVGHICWGAGIEATKRDFGAVLCHHPSDIENANIIVLWGRNPVETNLHLVPYIKKAKRHGCKVYLIDPRESKSAELADVHIKLKPDSDWALVAACVVKCLQKERLHKAFINRHLDDATGVLPYLSQLKETDYALLLEAAGIGDDIVDTLTHDLYENGPSTCYLGYGLQRYNDGGLNVRSVNFLWALTGNIGRKGGGVNYANQTNQAQFSFSFALPKKTPTVREMMLGRLAYELGRANPPVQVLFIGAANPVSQLPDSEGVSKALAAIPFKISLEHFLTDTAAMCELVLPVTYFTEAEDVITSGMWNSSFKYVAKCVEPLAECKSEFDIFQELAHRLELAEYPTFSATQWLAKGMLSPILDKGWQEPMGDP
ncbi:MAG: molybdopterin-dependent oxidoreductase [Firmicutes bacterium]|nr:molybdopterin-dependent oxidoreductase [Bacillota bacterium]